MKDRVVQHPGRYQLVPVAGTTDQFDLVAVPGTITEAGTNLNVANLLSDTTAAALAAALGITAPTTPNEAFAGLANPASYKKLLAVTVGTAAASISLDLSGITTSDYAEIIVIAGVKTSAITNINCTVNNLSSGYYGAYLQSNSTSVASISAASSFGSFRIADTSYAASIRLGIKSNYGATGAAYGILGIDFDGGTTGAAAGDYRSGSVSRWTDAVLSSVRFVAASGNISVGSKFYVYGVKK